METDRELIYRMTIAINRLDGAYYLWSRQMGVNENGLALLYALYDGGPMSQKQVSQEWLIPKTTINSIVKEYRQAGYLTLEPAQGRGRERLLVLTERGRAYARQLLETIHAAEQEALTLTRAQVPGFEGQVIRALELFGGHLDRILQEQQTDKEPKG